MWLLPHVTPAFATLFVTDDHLDELKSALDENGLKYRTVENNVEQ